MKKQPSIKDLEQLGLILASVNDILADAYWMAGRMFRRNSLAMKNLDVINRNLQMVRDALEREAFRCEYIADDVFFPALSKRGKLVFPIGDE